MPNTNGRARAQATQAAGICTQCRKPRDGDAKWHCLSCRAKQAERRSTDEYQIKRRDQSNARRANLRAQVINGYGARCACCGFTGNIKFLTLDHVNNDGGKDRTRTPSQETRLLELVRQNFPTHIQVLCWNCNCAKRDNGGVCPHTGIVGTLPRKNDVYKTVRPPIKVRIDLRQFVLDFRKGLLDDLDSASMCMAICAPLVGLLEARGVKAELVTGKVPHENSYHTWLRLADGRILDPTADQFKRPNNRLMPYVYIGEKPSWYHEL